MGVGVLVGVAVGALAVVGVGVLVGVFVGPLVGVATVTIWPLLETVVPTVVLNPVRVIVCVPTILVPWPKGLKIIAEGTGEKVIPLANVVVLLLNKVGVTPHDPAMV